MVKSSTPGLRRRDRVGVRLGLGIAVAVAVLMAGSARGEGVGLGIGIEPLHFPSGAGDLLIAGRNAAPVSFYVPIQLTPRLRLEPSAAYFHVRRGRAGTPVGASSYDFGTTAIGLGALYFPVSPKPFGFYLGARLTAAIYSGTFWDQDLQNQVVHNVTNVEFFLAPVLGGEVALSKSFAVGVEGQLSIALIGDNSARTLGDSNTPYVGRPVSANVVFFMRYFFR